MWVIFEYKLKRFLRNLSISSMFIKRWLFLEEVVVKLNKRVAELESALSDAVETAQVALIYGIEDTKTKYDKRIKKLGIENFWGSS